MTKILGYIVTSMEGPLCVTAYYDGPPVLVYSRRGGDLFPSRAHAKRLIRQTVNYSFAHNLKWDEDYAIVPLRSAP